MLLQKAKRHPADSRQGRPPASPCTHAPCAALHGVGHGAAQPVQHDAPQQRPHHSCGHGDCSKKDVCLRSLEVKHFPSSLGPIVGKGSQDACTRGQRHARLAGLRQAEAE